MGTDRPLSSIEAERVHSLHEVIAMIEATAVLPQFKDVASSPQTPLFKGEYGNQSVILGLDGKEMSSGVTPLLAMFNFSGARVISRPSRNNLNQFKRFTFTPLEQTSAEVAMSHQSQRTLPAVQVPLRQHERSRPLQAQSHLRPTRQQDIQIGIQRAADNTGTIEDGHKVIDDIEATIRKRGEELGITFKFPDIINRITTLTRSIDQNTELLHGIYDEVDAANNLLANIEQMIAARTEQAMRIGIRVPAEGHVSVEQKFAFGLGELNPLEMAIINCIHLEDEVIAEQKGITVREVRQYTSAICKKMRLPREEIAARWKQYQAHQSTTSASHRTTKAQGEQPQRREPGNTAQRAEPVHTQQSAPVEDLKPHVKPIIEPTHKPAHQVIPAQAPNPISTSAANIEAVEEKSLLKEVDRLASIAKTWLNGEHIIAPIAKATIGNREVFIAIHKPVGQEVSFVGMTPDGKNILGALSREQVIEGATYGHLLKEKQIPSGRLIAWEKLMKIVRDMEGK